MAHYLMTLIEGYGDYENLTHYIVEADSRQMVKYYFHHTLKGRGYHDADWGDKHHLDSWDSGHVAIENITLLDPVERKVMENHITEWTVDAEA